MKELLGVVLAVVLGVAGSKAYIIHQKSKEPVKEFVCYTHDKLTERHVGVAKASFTALGVVRITYVEGNSVYYMPRSGESCAVEEVR